MLPFGLFPCQASCHPYTVLALGSLLPRMCLCVIIEGDPSSAKCSTACWKTVVKRGFRPFRGSLRLGVTTEGGWGIYAEGYARGRTEERERDAGKVAWLSFTGWSRWINCVGRTDRSIGELKTGALSALCCLRWCELRGLSPATPTTITPQRRELSSSWSQGRDRLGV